ncbi:ROK family protein [Herbiconiux sp. KACC 21604]|uniref:ROK family protein n=1 Tax=unclassified Herbiconiux TaxID=2618217 RepID=UPI001491406F|nr:ROK family protein [Herbiconiux sp. SALV-R1]QJU55620.1 ROK family protein [Herbiconiux sp. SALV-R1]WPO86817.1 ROK family protein [Herbiconiux sp. KACC 21604]
MTELCIDFGGSAIKLGVCDAGRILTRSELSVHGTPDDLARAAAELRRLVEQLPAGDVGRRGASATGGADTGAQAWGGASVVAIAVPGVVDRGRAALVAAHAKYGYLAGRDLDAWAREAFGLPAVVENDARAALLGETRYGVARGAQNAVIAVFGTGIGTAALLDGRLLHGSHDHAGILGGHVTIDLDGPVCSCGNVGCAEAIASTWALERSLAAIERVQNRTHGDDQGALALGTREIRDSEPGRGRAGEGGGLRGRIEAGRAVGIADIVETLEHPDSRALLDLYVRAWSAAIVGLCHAYDPDVVVVSGGVMRSAPLILPALTQQVHAHLWSSSSRPPLVVPEHPDSSVVLGLSALARATDDSATERPRTR